jgi:hypothetical protein
LGKVGILLPEEAREKCQKVLGNVAHGLGRADGLTLGEFIEETYAPWVRTNRVRTVGNTLEKLHRQFRTWFSEPLSARQARADHEISLA